MKMKIIEIQNKGDHSKEYIRLEATDDCELGEYSVADTTYTGDNRVSNKIRHFHWFPDKELEKGEQVVLRTGTGTDKTYTADNGKTVHRRHWGLGAAVWNDDKDVAVLFHIDDWAFKKVGS